MTWREDQRRVRITINGQPRDLIGASFRGVPFFVDASNRSGGRRVVVHEFPLRADPFVEDLGRRARKFPVTGYVIGDDYLAQRDALMVALEDTDGPGQLIHPYYGSKVAICDTVTVGETSTAGGMATFAVDFVEAPAQAPTPTVDIDPAADVGAGATAAVTAAKVELGEKYSALGLPSSALTSAETAVTSAAAAVQAKLGPVVTVTQELAELNGRVTILTAQAAALVRSPADLFDAFYSTLTGLDGTVEATPGAVMDALMDAYDVDLGPDVPTTTATRQRERANQLALIGALRRALAVEAARLAPLVPYASIEDATAARDRVAGLLEEQALGAGDTAYPALVDLRSQVLRAVPGTKVFARVVTVTRRVAIPSLLLTYQLYGAVDREADVLARNNVRHPGFLAGDLKVLSADA